LRVNHTGDTVSPDLGNLAYHIINRINIWRCNLQEALRGALVLSRTNADTLCIELQVTETDLRLDGAEAVVLEL